MGMTENYDYYVFILNDFGVMSLAVASTTDTIHICPNIAKTPNKYMFNVVSSYEHGHFYNFVANGDLIKTDTSLKDARKKFMIDSAYWKTPPDLNRIVYRGFDGSSFEKPIKIKRARSIKESIAAQYAFVEKELGKRGIIWKPIRQYFLYSSKKYYDVIEVEIIKTDEKRYFWFDLNNIFGKL